jgi:hypothetical protein
MSKGMFPALHLSSGLQSYKQISTNHYDGNLLAIVAYYDKWTSQSSQHDVIRANIAADLEVMKSNAAKKAGLIGSGHTQQSQAITRITLSPYTGEFDETIAPFKLIYRTMELSISIPPYDEIE